MIGRITVVAISICIGACASTSREAPAPAVKASPASVDAVATGNPPTQPTGNLDEMASADAPQTASAEPESDPDELICRREKEVGSNFTKKICRTRAEIEQRAAEDQAIMETGRRIQTGSSCALNGEC